MDVRIDDEWQYRGYRAVVLENDLIRADVFPEIGARIWNFVHKRSGVNLMWHHPRMELRAAPLGANYDDNFCGGWDELFPNDAAGPVGEHNFVDHGELWCQPWDYTIERGNAEVTLRLRRAGSTITTTVEKTITLRAGESQLRFGHRITNVGRAPIDFLWKLHPALAIEEGDRLDIPGNSGEIVDPSFGHVAGPSPFPWPVAKGPNGKVDFSVVRAENGTRDFVYVRELREGWCALRRTRSGVGFGLAFPKEIFTSVWVFMTFGGWRGLNTLVLEPCTAVPKDLNTAIRLKQCSHLEPGATLACEIRGVAFDGAEPIKSIRPDGTVVR